MLRKIMVWPCLFALLFALSASGALAAGPDLVVDTKAVADKVGNPDWVLLDTRTPEEYKQGHIPGAINLGKRADKALRDPSHRVYTILPAVERTLGSAGISNDKHVIVYGKAVDVFYTAVSFWALEYLGCNSPSLKCTAHYYDGGIEQWEKSKGAMEETDHVLPAAEFKAKPMASRLATSEEVMDIVKGREKAVIIDTRTEAEYNGADIRALRGGHIPGALNIKVQKNYDGEAYRMLPRAELETLYKEIPLSERVVMHCQTGTRSTYTYLVLRTLGYTNIGNYDDSWIVYGSNVNYPVVGEQWFDFLDVGLAIKAVKEMHGAK